MAELLRLAGLNLKKEASVPLSRIKDLRFGTQGSPYRTSLQISKEVESRWITVIYTVSSSSRQVLNSAANYKLVHFIAPTIELVELWKTTLERFKEGRIAKGVAGGELPHEELEVPVEEQTRVVEEAEVHQLCARLGVGMGRTEVSAAFRVGMCSFSRRRPLTFPPSPENGSPSRLPRLCRLPRVCQASQETKGSRRGIPSRRRCSRRLHRRSMGGVLAWNPAGAPFVYFSLCAGEADSSQPSTARHQPRSAQQVVPEVRRPANEAHHPRRLRLLPHVVRQRRPARGRRSRHDSTDLGVLHQLESQRRWSCSERARGGSGS